MNKIHSCTEARPAAACSFPSPLGAGSFSGCPRGWGGDRADPKSFAGSQRGGGHWLTHLRLLPEIAARRLASLRHVTPVPPRRGPLRRPPRGGVWCLGTTPGNTPGSHPHAGTPVSPSSPAGTRWHGCHQPDTRVARGDKDALPLHTPTSEASRCGTGAQWAPPMLPPAASASTPHAAPSPAVPGPGGGTGGRSPQDGWVELNPIWFHYRPQSPEPWLLSSQASKGPGGGGGGTASPALWSIPLLSREKCPCPPFLPSPGSVAGGMSPTHEGAAA